jgi:predicted alpha/beta hydrolase family esterase
MTPPPARAAVLLVHGAGGGAWEWNTWRRVLGAAAFDAVAPDLRPVAAGIAATRLADYVAQVDAALAALPRPRILVGASLGGLLALRCAAPADALVLVNPLPPAPLHDALPVATELPAVVAWGARASLAGTRAALPDASDGEAWFAFRRWRDESGAVLREARAGVAVARPRCPVLVLASSTDSDIACALSLRVANALGAASRVLEGASHVGALFGSHAVAAARETVTWLNVNSAREKFSDV